MIKICPMSWWPFKKSSNKLTVEFLALYPHLQDTYPIYPAKDLTLPWIKESQTSLSNTSIIQKITKKKVHKCAGIRDFHNKGWIIPAWHDFIIETNGDGESFRSHVPSDYLNKVLNGARPISSFGASQYGSLPSSGLPQNTLMGIVKLSMPWVFRITPGWGLMMCPLEYTKEHRFTSAIGIIDPNVTPQLNVILYWHILNGATSIKAGTPLCRLLPVPLNDTWNLSVRQANTEEKDYNEACTILSQSHWSNFNSKVLTHLYDTVILKNARL